jgi:hypothetical protein
MTAPALDRLRDETLTELEQVVKDAYADHADDCTDRPDQLLDDPTAWLPAAWLEALLSEVRRHRHIPAAVLAGLLDGTMVAVHRWRPIATAPKDGTEVLWRSDRGTVAVISWPTYEACFADDGSSWMPLPETPMLAAAKQEDRA